MNGGDTATVKVGNDKEFTLEVVENPVPEIPFKTEVTTGGKTAELQETVEGGASAHNENGKKDLDIFGAVLPGEEITYRITYRNYKKETADVVITDILDKNVEFVSASDDGAVKDGIVTWTLKGVAAGYASYVDLTVVVKDSAVIANGGPGKVDNQASAKVGVNNVFDEELWTNEEENPVPEPPHKKEVTPYEGTGVLGAVKVGDEITYEISYRNYKDSAADVVIKDTLDKNVEFVRASAGGKLQGGVVTWTVQNVAAGKSGKVTLTVKVLEGALESNKGPGKVVNGGDNATVKIGNDKEFTLEVVENPVPEEPHKKETAPYEGNGLLGAVNVGDEITYEISYKNYKAEAADVVIKDTLDKNVEFVAASDGGVNTNGVVTWTIKGVAAGKEGKVALTVKVLEGALESKKGPGKVVNGGDNATVKVGNDNEFTLETVENPVPEEPHKSEVAPYVGNGVLGAVKVGDEITYQIDYINYKKEAADVVIKDTLDKNVEFVSASDGGVNTNGVVTWTLKEVAAGKAGSVTLTVKVLEGALESNKGPGKVVNGGDTATVKVGNDKEFTLEVVENPVPEGPHKKETAPYEGTGVLGAVKVGDQITYEISYKNYKAEAADVVIKDTLDKNVEFVAASDGGVNTDGVVNWTIKEVAAGKEGKVVLTVKVLEGALESKGGLGKVVNGGDSTTVKVGNDSEYSVETVENPVPEPPHKKEIAPYEGNGILGTVKVGDEITYQISFVNYKTTAADVTIEDKLDKNVEFVSASDGGTLTEGVVTWKLKDVSAGDESYVTLTVKVLEGALEKNEGPGKVVNGGDTATVQIGNDNKFTLETVENPVREVKRVIEGTAWLDDNKDGIRQDKDKLLPDVPVALIKVDEDGTRTVVDRTTTDENGFYKFEDVEEGTYELVFDKELDVTIKSDVPDGKNSIADGTKDGEGNPTGGIITRIEMPTDEELFEMLDNDELPDGIYVKEYQDAGFIQPADKVLEVTKTLVLPDGTEIYARDRVFYVALFADSEGTEMISEIMPLTYKNAASATVQFTGLVADKTYYVREVDQDGNVIESGVLDGVIYVAEFEEDGGEVTFNEETGMMRVSFKNEFVEIPDNFYKKGELSITKKLLGVDGKALATKDVFYAGIFSDKELTTLSEDVDQNVIELSLAGNSEVTVQAATHVDPGKTMTFYVAETDANGKPVDQSTFAYAVTIQNGEVVMTEENLTGSVTIVNQKKPEVTVTPTPKPNTPPGNGAKTGDDTPIATLMITLGIALAAILAAVLILMKKKKKQ